MTPSTRPIGPAKLQHATTARPYHTAENIIADRQLRECHVSQGPARTTPDTPLNQSWPPLRASRSSLPFRLVRDRSGPDERQRRSSRRSTPTMLLKIT